MYKNQKTLIEPHSSRNKSANLTLAQSIFLLYTAIGFQNPNEHHILSYDYIKFIAPADRKHEVIGRCSCKIEEKNQTHTFTSLQVKSKLQQKENLFY